VFRYQKNILSKGCRTVWRDHDFQEATYLTLDCETGYRMSLWQLWSAGKRLWGQHITGATQSVANAPGIVIRRQEGAVFIDMK
jgi:hypothetical protein